MTGKTVSKCLHDRFAGVQATGATNLFYVGMALLGILIVVQVFFSARTEEKLVAQQTPEAMVFHTWAYLFAGVLALLLGIGLTISVLKLP